MTAACFFKVANAASRRTARRQKTRFRARERAAPGRAPVRRNQPRASKRAQEETVMFELRRTFTTPSDKTNERFERVWADFALPALGWTAASVPSAPPADVVETANEIVVLLDLPGRKSEEIQIKVDKDVLTVESERKLDSAQKGDTYHRSERSYGKFARSFTLPANVDASRTEAKYEAGVLQITLPKREEAKPRTIQINVKS
jgi:HSP20 family protein